MEPNMRAIAAGMAVLTIGFAGSQAARAQQALDRLAPIARASERAPEEVAPKDKVAIEVDAPVGTAVSGGGAILVGAISLAGLQQLKPADFADIVEARMGQSLSPDQLSALANTIAERARTRGFAFASAWIEPQRVASGVLVIHVDEGRIDEIRFDGPVHSSVRAALEPLIDGKPARIEQVERRLLIARDIDGVRIRSSRFLREQGRGILLVRVTQERVVARAALSNEGTKPLGPEQIRLDVDLNALFFADDVLTVTYSATPAELRELQFGRVRYAKRVDSSGTEIALTGSASVARPGAYLSQLDIRSRSWFVGMSVLRPLWRRRSASLFFEGEFGVRDLVQHRRDRRVRHDRLAVARATLYGYSDVGGGRLRTSVTLSQGLGVLGATTPGDPLASRFDADGSFTALNAWSEWTRGLGGNFSLRIAAQSQLASDPLLITEEVGLGGTAFLRGYEWSERTGDQGAMAMGELRYDWNKPFGLIRRAQLYTFFDAGRVTNIGGDYGSGSLASAGGGVRADISNDMGANVELGLPLSGPRYDTGDTSPKVNLRLVKSF
jgi:hemolysin activation/secretion protein